MRKLVWSTFAVIVVFASNFVLADDSISEQKIVEKIELLGGKVTRDETKPGRPVVKVDFKPTANEENPRFNDKYLHLLTSLPHLEILDLTKTATTDEGLGQVIQLKSLKSLRLGGTQITADGLLQLTTMKQLELLDLWEKSRDDSSEPSTFEDLKTYQVHNPKPTQVIIDQLRKNLPGLKIRRVPQAICQPNRISIGNVGVGAVVETSVRVFVPGNDLDGLKTTASASESVHVVRTETKTQQFGNRGVFICHDVFVSLDTSTAKNLDGTLCIGIRDAEIEIPVSASVLKPGDDDATQILIVNTPFNRFSSSDASMLEPWRALVESAKLVPQYLESELGRKVIRLKDLSKMDVILLAGTGLIDARDDDFARLKEFAESGGRVVIAANFFYRGTVEKANQFIGPLGLRMTDVEPGAGIGVVEVQATQLVEHQLTEGVERLKFFRPSPISIEDQQKGTILVKTDVFADQGLVAVAKVGRGEVVVLGISLWWNWIASNNESGADNTRLLQNLLTKQKSN